MHHYCSLHCNFSSKVDRNFNDAPPPHGYTSLVDGLPAAAEKGHVPVMQLLLERGAVDTFANALVDAIRTNQLEAAQWLIPSTEGAPEYCVMDEAARRGRVNMLQFFQSLASSGANSFFPAAAPAPQGEENRPGVRSISGLVVEDADPHRKIITNKNVYRLSWTSSEPMDDAAANGELEAVKWLHENRSEGCTTAAMDEAAANGHLGVLQWLHENRSEGCTAHAMDFAASNGHLEVVQWLQAHTLAGCTTAAMDLAAAGGHMKVLKWLSSNRSEGCTVAAIENAVSNGHLRVAIWLMERFPDFAPAKFTVPNSAEKLDVLLFLHAHFPEVFTPSFVLDARRVNHCREDSPRYAMPRSQTG
ncbi:unnamed protein product [Phytophthora lilii]|uniref:Unnamed protein product n=1 Tax=Phytophthora lilii TaxID=2077276 RepID=A0A9W6XL61_9STRA|nr:unnamed protein product [Phytophthora lilii]